MLWQLFLPFLTIIIISLIAVTVYFTTSLRSFHIKQLTVSLESSTALLKTPITRYLLDENFNAVDSLAKFMGDKTSTRFTVVLPDGTVVGDSEENPEQMEKHDTRPEIAVALNGKTGSAIRYSNTLQIDLLYVASPIYSDNQLLAIVRAAVPVTSIDETLDDVFIRIALGGFIVALLAAMVSLYVSRRISRPLEELKAGAEHFASGDFSHILPAPETEEVKGLSDAMNQMASQLDDRIKTIDRQRNEQQAVLASMTEGVLAIDTSEKIISINKAAERLFRIESKNIIGKNVLEVVRNADLLKLIDNALKATQTIESEITLDTNGERYLQAHGTPLRDSRDQRIGVLIVLNDLTRIRRLESMRKDFVANVSHELKTPITSIIGFVETLKEGAVEHPEDARKFLDIIARQSDRLNAIVDDILSLSRIEEGSDKGEILFEERNINNVVKSAIQACELKASEKSIKIDIDCRADITHPINGQLIEQAIVNLIDNAVKYSDNGNPILVFCDRKDHEIIIGVRDNGTGIKREHLPRLFERFYRVDKARSRKIGGTGLGLAIVKHIALAHNGTVSVESTLGQGSTFTIHLPV